MEKIQTIIQLIIVEYLKLITFRVLIMEKVILKPIRV